MKKFLKVKDVAELLNVSPSTVRLYTNTGQLEYGRTKNGQRYFTQEQVDKYLGKTQPEDKIAFYVRSSNGNKTLMSTQIEQLTDKYGTPIKIYQDKASGLRETRPALQKLIQDAKDKKINKIYITNKDRLARFGYKYIEDHLNTLGAKIEVMNNQQEVTLQEELLQDFMSLIASFSGKFYGLRGYEQQRKLLDKAKGELDEKKETN